MYKQSPSVTMFVTSWVIGVFGIVLLFIVVLLTACQQTVGFGETIDFQAPTLMVQRITLPDDSTVTVTADGNTVSIGPGILLGPNCTLSGSAWDNVRVTGITVTGVAVTAGAAPRTWTDAVIGPRDSEGTQTWSITLAGITRGEWNITINAFDTGKNVGPNMTQSLTLLVDTEPPFVERVTVERQPGVSLHLRSLADLQALDPAQFDHIDYFHNEAFTIRAVITHEFKLSDVTLNLVDEQGQTVFDTDLDRSGGTLFTPEWYIDAALLTAANEAYAAGRHYLKVMITAVAEAGHSGQYAGGITNLLYNLCWYPAADAARIQSDITAETVVMPNDVVPVTVYDDDNLGAVYTALVTKPHWDAFMPGATDEQKLHSLYEAAARHSFTTDTGGYPLRTNQLSAAVRTATIPVTCGSERGAYRLIVLARDQKADDTAAPVWSHALYPLQVMEAGIPLISLTMPAENSSPPLTAGETFTVQGSVLNRDPVAFLHIAWVPDGLGWNADKQLAEGQHALINHIPGTTAADPNGIIIWDDIPLTAPDDQVIGGITFQKQSFTHTLNIFNDFIYNDARENAPKFFILYTRGAERGSEVFQTFRLLPYTAPPLITTAMSTVYGVGTPIPFVITVKPADDGIPVTAVTLTREQDAHRIPLTGDSDGTTWRAVWTEPEQGYYTYTVQAENKLGHSSDMELVVFIDTLPTLQALNTPHIDNSWLSSQDTLTLEAVFSGPVHEHGVQGLPALELDGFTDEQKRYAAYASGAGSTTLRFTYPIQAGDKTDGKLRVTGLRQDTTNSISAIIPAWTAVTPLTQTLRIDGIAPVITGITFAQGAPETWLTAGQELPITVTVSKAVKILGTPQLRLAFSGGMTDAEYVASAINPLAQTTALTFVYKVQAGDTANPVSCNAASCFTTEDLMSIVDTIGSTGNPLALTADPLVSGTVYIDTTPPAQLSLEELPESNALHRQYKIKNGDGTIEDGATITYTTGDSQWRTLDNPSDVIAVSAGEVPTGAYSVAARQTDRAGNEGPPSAPHTFMFVEEGSLAALVCLNPDGTYPRDAELKFKMYFSGMVTSAAGTDGPSITLKYAHGYDGDGQPIIEVPLTTPVTEAQTTLEFVWKVPRDLTWYSLAVADINLNGILLHGTPVSGDIAQVITDYNTKRSGIQIMSVPPTISTFLQERDGEYLYEDYGNHTYLGITSFNIRHMYNITWQDVTIILKPVGDYSIPLSLSVSAYNAVRDRLNSDEQIELDKAYTLVPAVEFAPAYYELNFDKGPNDPGYNNEPYGLRTLFNKADYMVTKVNLQQSIPRNSGYDASYIIGDMDNKHKKWEILIPEGAFRNAEGNLSEAFSATFSIHEQICPPVIRVKNRFVSHNDPTTPPVAQLHYRIDSELLNAQIYYKTLHKGADVTTNPEKIEDANSSEFDAITFTEYTYTHTGTDFPLIGTTGADSLYTAGKDYIVAYAAKDGLTDSEEVTEALFKTVVVFRDKIKGSADDQFVKITGTDGYYVYNFDYVLSSLPPTTPGFPLSLDTSNPLASKYAYKNETASYTDWIWTTWEIVTDFHVRPFRTSIAEPDTSTIGNMHFNTANYYPGSYGNGILIEGFTQTDGHGGYTDAF